MIHRYRFSRPGMHEALSTRSPDLRLFLYHSASQLIHDPEQHFLLDASCQSHKIAKTDERSRWSSWRRSRIDLVLRVTGVIVFTGTYIPANEDGKSSNPIMDAHIGNRPALALKLDTRQTSAGKLAWICCMITTGEVITPWASLVQVEKWKRTCIFWLRKKKVVWNKHWESTTTTTLAERVHINFHNLSFKVS